MPPAGRHVGSGFSRCGLVRPADEDDEATADSAANWEKQHADLRVALLGRTHDTLAWLRDRDEIDDNVLQQVQAALDLERVAVDRHRKDT